MRAKRIARAIQGAGANVVHQRYGAMNAAKPPELLLNLLDRFFDM